MKAILEPQVLGPEFDPSIPLRNSRWELVIQNKLKGLSNVDAYRRVYKNVSKGSAGANFSDLLRKPKFAGRLRWLNEQAASLAVANIFERKEILTDIARQVGRQNPVDYIEHDGERGTWLKFNVKSPNPKAISSIKTRTELHGRGEDAQECEVSEIRLRPFTEAISAIDILNKMDRIYVENQSTLNVIAILDRLGMRALEPRRAG